MGKPKTISIDNEVYMRAADIQPIEHDGELSIVILQRGWVMVGRLEEDGDMFKLHNGAVIRKWGTTAGLPELAEKGPLSGTVLDKSTGLTRFHVLTTIAILACNEASWSSY